MSLVVDAIGPGATVQDRGRVGSMHLGVPRGGALDPERFERVRRSLGNGPDSAAIELPWHGARFRATAPTVVSVDGVVHALATGDVLRVEAAAAAVRYVGLRGGVDVPRVLGGRGTLLVAGLGGLDGRMLRKGDVLVSGRDVVGDAATLEAVMRDDDVIALLRCEGAPAVCVEALREGVFTVTTRVDRVGMRLTGDVPRGLVGSVSVPLVRGAIEVTPDGELIVMGPDHPTTGAYPLVGVVARRCHGALAQRRPGATVRFAFSERSATTRSG